MTTKTLEPKQTNYWELKNHFEETKNEGLVFYGCGGDLKNWVNGIGEVLLEEEEDVKGDRVAEAGVEHTVEPG